MSKGIIHRDKINFNIHIIDVHLIRMLVVMLAVIGLLSYGWYYYEPMEETKVVYISKHSRYAGATASIVNFNNSFDIEKDSYHGPSEEDVYTFLQGPKAWEGQTDWSGDWCLQYLQGGNFGAFGCGMCCMANIYSTLTDYECSPLDMYYRARELTGYSPVSGNAAIGWGDLKQTLKSVGFSCDVYNKPDNYEDFKEQMLEAKSAIVLVSSYEDDSFWTDTGGHYVNIWLYNKETDEVFLAEPGSPTNNRKWIPLRYVYDALKTISKYQYLTVTDYDETKNDWMVNEINAEWIKPSYY